MVRHVLRSACLVGAVLAVLLLAPEAGAEAPGVVLTIPANRVTADHAFVVRYRALDVPAGSVLYLQKQEGTARVWKSIKAWKSTSGSALAPGVPLGMWTYRIIAVHAGRVLAASEPRVLYAYGNVPLGVICRGHGVCTTPHTEVVATHAFTWVTGIDTTFATEYPKFYAILNANSTTCRSAVLEFASQRPTTPGTGKTYIELLQASSDPQEASTGPNSVGVLRATLDGGPWYVEVSDTQGKGVVVNGTWSCYTPTGY